MANVEDFEIKVEELQSEIRRLNAVIQDVLVKAFIQANETHRSLLEFLRKNGN